MKVYLTYYAQTGEVNAIHAGWLTHLLNLYALEKHIDIPRNFFELYEQGYK